MLSFLKRRQQKKPAGPPARDPLKAVPSVLSGVEARFDTEDLAQIRRQPPKSDSIAAWLSRRFGLSKNYRYKLDKHGSYFWTLVNGKRDLRTISRAFVQEFEMDQPEAERAVLQFTQMLMLRGLIGLRVPGMKRGEVNSGTRE